MDLEIMVIMGKVLSWLTDAAVLVRVIAVALTAIAGAMGDAALFEGELGAHLVKLVSSSRSSAEPVALLLLPSPLG